ncbi:MAG: hypothetical protein M3P11_02445 [Actinomycetota bacterium]|nr:hypothetical protein [Actinomycetota bacterium]
MNRRIALGAALVLVLIAAAVGWSLTRPGVKPAFAQLRQSEEQEVPGSFGLILKPPPSAFEPAISPSEAQQVASQGRTAPGPVLMTLASVGGFYTGASSDTPQWLVIVRNLCYPGEKGELVSGSRHLGDNKNCSMNNLWIQFVDPTTGDRVAVLRAYDPTATWLPTTGAT